MFSVEKFRGFAFVTYRKIEDTKRVAEMEKHIIAGKEVQVKLAISKEETREKLLDEKNRKVFLFNISRSISEGITLD